MGSGDDDGFRTAGTGRLPPTPSVHPSPAPLRLRPADGAPESGRRDPPSPSGADAAPATSRSRTRRTARGQRRLLRTTERVVADDVRAMLRPVSGPAGVPRPPFCPEGRSGQRTFRPLWPRHARNHVEAPTDSGSRSGSGHGERRCLGNGAAAVGGKGKATRSVPGVAAFRAPARPRPGAPALRRGAGAAGSGTEGPLRSARRRPITGWRRAGRRPAARAPRRRRLTIAGP